MDDFFTWCKTSIENENKNFDFDNYFMVTSLIFEEDYEIELDKKNKKITLKTSQGELIMPKLKITKKENVSE